MFKRLSTKTKKSIYKIIIFLRKIRASERSLPDFIILGAQKAGTSSFYQQLCKHPQIERALKKEAQYFTLHYHQGVSWYKAFFPFKKELLANNAITGEATPFYLYLEEVPKRIIETVPGVKLIILLRNPIKRTISHFEFLRKKNTETRTQEEFLKEFDYSIEKMLNHERKLNDINQKRNFSYITRSLYSEQIENYEKYFDKKDMKIIISESYFMDSQNVFDEVSQFLSIESFDFGISPRVHENKKKIINNDFEILLFNFFQDEFNRLEEKGIDISIWK